MSSLKKNLSFPGRFWLLLAVCLTFFTFLIGFSVCIVELSQNQSATIYPLLYIRRLYHLDSQLGRNFFSRVIPGFNRYRTEDDPDFILDTKNADLLFRFLVNIRYPSHQEMFKTQFPILSFVENEKNYHLTPVVSRSLPKQNLIPPTRTLPLPQEQPHQILPKTREEPATKVLIYHSHTSESYLPVSGKTHIQNGRGDVVRVGASLANYLNNVYGIKTTHCDTIHDQYPFRDSYKRSAITVKQLLDQHSKVEVVLDIHRDATPGLNHQVKIGGKSAAKIILVVGSDQMGLHHPNWEKNHAFAKSLLGTMDRLYPGLAHGIILSEARYNQHLHQHSIIVEFGDEKSTWEEVNYSIQLFAEVLASHQNLSTTGYSM